VFKPNTEAETKALTPGIKFGPRWPRNQGAKTQATSLATNDVVNASGECEKIFTPTSSVSTTTTT